MSERVAVIARITARPEAADEVEAALRTLVDAATDEDGTVEYVLNREGDSGSFWFYELYADQAAFDAHGQNPALGAAFGRFGSLMAEPPELHVLTPVQAKHFDLSRVTTYLDQILEGHRSAAAADDRSLEALLDDARAMGAPRGFGAALARSAAIELAVIAEVKRRSPSKGDLAVDLDAADTARAYVEGGAACLSVLTDEDWFGGSPDDLRVAQAAVSVPVLRKDFTVDARDVCDARLMGADAVLLIVAALDDAELTDLHALALELELDALVEVHDEAELARALAVGATLVGVNQRDLVSFEVDTDRAARVGAAMPAEVLRVAESGIRGADDARRIADAGFHAVLVGESIVTARDRAASVAALRVARR